MRLYPKYRIKKVYSLNAYTGAPESNYMVERKTSLFSKWEGVRMFLGEMAAVVYMEELIDQKK